MGVLLQPQEEPVVVTEEDQGAAKCRRARWKLQESYFPATQVLLESLPGMGWEQEGEREVRGLPKERKAGPEFLPTGMFLLAGLQPCPPLSPVPWPLVLLPGASDPCQPRVTSLPSEGSRSKRSGAGGAFTVSKSNSGLERMTQSRERIIVGVSSRFGPGRTLWSSLLLIFMPLCIPFSLLIYLFHILPYCFFV